MPIPSNLLRGNLSQFTSSLEPSGADVTQAVPQLDEFVLPAVFATGSYDDIRNAISSVTIPSLPGIPTFGDIQAAAMVKLDRIKQAKRDASILALKVELERVDDPFQYRNLLKNASNKER